MGFRRDPRIDAYIRRAKPFARPLLTRIRALAHRGYPPIEEAVKWGMPSFLVDGKIVCGMAGFTRHGALWFWNSAALVRAGVLKREWMTAGMGAFGKLTSVRDLPPGAAVARAVRRAALLRKGGAVKTLRQRKSRS